MGASSVEFSNPPADMVEPTRSPFDCLLPLMRSKGVTLSAAEFHSHVNLVFHSFESEVYDSQHRAMWRSLPAQFDLLVGDYLSVVEPKHKLRVLDVGCGTGLSAELLLRSPLGQYIESFDLLDTSPRMLDVCQKRAKTWQVPARVIQGTIQELEPRSYDWITVCSVLHHIPDLDGFCAAVRRLHETGGVFMHIHDPNGDYLSDSELLVRSKEAAEYQRAAARRFTARVGRKLRHLVAGARDNDEYLASVNRELMQKGVIASPMSGEEIWSVTDIHDQGLPFSTGSGIEISRMSERLTGYTRVSTRSYGFFGKLASELPPQLEREEDRLIKQRSPNGRFVGAVWRRD